MASIYRPTFVDRHGKRRKLRCWYIAYKDATGKRVKERGFRDRGATEIRAREIAKNVERELAGLPVAQLDRQLSEVYQLYADELRRLGRDHDYVRIMLTRLRAVQKACGWASLRSIAAEPLRKYLADRRASGKAAATVNQDKDVLSIFCNWCVAQGYLTENPVRRVKRIRQLSHGPRARRAYTPDEFAALVAAAPPARAAVYRLAALSGLRRKEMRLLTPVDYSLTDPPRWHLRASVAKGRRVDTVPMLPDAAAILRGVRKLRVPTFAEVQADIAAAGIAPVIDGRRVGFHSLRYYFCTMLARALPIQIVQRLMRHKSITMTADLYCDLGIHQLELQIDMAAVSALFK